MNVDVDTKSDVAKDVGENQNISAKSIQSARRQATVYIII